jgi:hypothetical protein
VQYPVSYSHIDEKDRVLKGYREVQNVCHLINGLVEIEAYVVKLIVPGSR